MILGPWFAGYIFAKGCQRAGLRLKNVGCKQRGQQPHGGGSRRQSAGIVQLRFWDLRSGWSGARGMLQAPRDPSAWRVGWKAQIEGPLTLLIWDVEASAVSTSKHHIEHLAGNYYTHLPGTLACVSAARIEQRARYMRHNHVNIFREIECRVFTPLSGR